MTKKKKRITDSKPDSSERLAARSERVELLVEALWTWVEIDQDATRVVQKHFGKESGQKSGEIPDEFIAEILSQPKDYEHHDAVLDKIKKKLREEAAKAPRSMPFEDIPKPYGLFVWMLLLAGIRERFGPFVFGLEPLCDGDNVVTEDLPFIPKAEADEVIKTMVEINKRIVELCLVRLPDEYFGRTQ